MKHLRKITITEAPDHPPGFLVEVEAWDNGESYTHTTQGGNLAQCLVMARDLCDCMGIKITEYPDFA